MSEDYGPHERCQIISSGATKISLYYLPAFSLMAVDRIFSQGVITPRSITLKQTTYSTLQAKSAVSFEHYSRLINVVICLDLQRDV